MAMDGKMDYEEIQYEVQDKAAGLVWISKSKERNATRSSALKN